MIKLFYRRIVMNEFKDIIEKFEDFIKRSILPSASFMLFLLIFDITLNNHSIITFIDQKHSYLTIALFILAFIGLSNLLSLLQQSIYDNRIKDFFNANLIWTNENTKLDSLRNQVNQKLNKDENDYMLYKIIAKDMETKEYVNQAKTFGIMFVSLMIVTFINIYSLINTMLFTSDYNYIVGVIINFIFIFIEYFIGKELVKSRYRSRAIKIYTNFLKEVS